MSADEQRTAGIVFAAIAAIVIAFLIFTSGFFWWGLLGGGITAVLIPIAYYLIKKKIDPDLGKLDWRWWVLSATGVVLTIWLWGLYTVVQGWIGN
ncbi:MAG: hypothetical protein OXK21_01240 [Chloroflexota bacterium]|nr:hypothetical protein [Chloroflexota bacterium]